jgi:4-hydroxy-tetrahydrodipicolinate synthase
VTEDGLFDAYASLVDQVGNDRLRLTVYNIPQVSGVRVPPGVAARLGACYGQMIAGVKDSSADFAQFRAFRAAAPELAVTVGAEPDIGRALAEGGAGTICGMGNIAPDLVRAMFRPNPPVASMQAACGLVSGPFIALLKSMLAARSGQASWLNVRPPLRPATMADGIQRLAQLDSLTRQCAA